MLILIKMHEEGKYCEEGSYRCENCDRETQKIAVYYCDVCEQKICEECALLHKKLKITQNHDLSSLQTIRNRNYDQEECIKHNMFADLYCITCKKFMCSSCDSKVHDEHIIELVDAAANLKRNILNKELKTCASFCASEKTLKFISQRECAVEEMGKKARDELHERANEIKKEIDAAVKKVENEITEVCEGIKYKLKQMKKDVESTQDKIGPWKKWITSANDTEVLREGDRMLFKLKEVCASAPKSLIDIQKVRFQKNSFQIISKHIGQVVTEKKNLPTTTMEIVSVFCTPEFNEIKCIIHCQGGKVWIVEEGINGLSLFNEWGSEHKKILEEFEIASAVMSNDGILFISVPAEKSIYKITDNNKATKYCSLSSIPGDISVFDNGNIAVCCNDPAKLVIIDQNGLIVRQYAPRGSKFKAIYCVAVCKFTDILAVYAQEIVDSSSAMAHLNSDVKQLVPTVGTSQASTAPPFGIVSNVSEEAMKLSSTLSFTSATPSLIRSKDKIQVEPIPTVGPPLVGQSSATPPGKVSNASEEEVKQSSTLSFTSVVPSLSGAKDDIKTHPVPAVGTPLVGQASATPPGKVSNASEEAVKQSSTLSFTSVVPSLFGTKDDITTQPMPTVGTSLLGQASSTIPLGKVPNVSEEKMKHDFNLSVTSVTSPLFNTKENTNAQSIPAVGTSQSDQSSFGKVPNGSKEKMKHSSNFSFAFGTPSFFSTKDKIKVEPIPTVGTPHVGQSAAPPGKVYNASEEAVKQSSTFSFGSVVPSLFGAKDDIKTHPVRAVGTPLVGEASATPPLGKVPNASEEVMKQNAIFLFTGVKSPLFSRKDNKKAEESCRKDTLVKSNIFLFDPKGNMITKFLRQIYDLIFDNQSHLLVCLEGGNIDVMDYRGNILTCLRPNGGDFLCGKIAIDSFSRLWIGQSGRINVFRYSDAFLDTKDEDQ